jgi:hypothetical protein
VAHLSSEPKPSGSCVAARAPHAYSECTATNLGLTEDAHHSNRQLRHADGNGSTLIILSCDLVVRSRSRAGPLAFGLPPVEVQRIRQRPGALGSARRARALRRLTARCSSADSPPQTPSSWRDSVAQRRQGSTTSQRRQTALASSSWTSAGPVLPIGKNISGSTPRQAARSRQVIRIGLLASKMGRAARESTQTANRLVLSCLSQRQLFSQRQGQRQVNVPR